MELRYYADTDTLYIGLSKAVTPESREVAPDIVLDYDDRGQVISIEIEHAGRHADLSRLEAMGMPLEDLIFKGKAAAKL